MPGAPLPAVSTPYTLRNLGGRNGGIPPYNIEDSEFAELINYYPEHKILRVREGLTRVSGLPNAVAITGLDVYDPEIGNYTVMVGLATGIGILSGSSVLALPSTTVSITSDVDTLWFMLQYKGVEYCLRKDLGILMRSDGSQLNSAGIAAPGTALTAAEGGAGDLEAGDYEIVYSNYNSVTGAESDVSPVATVTIAANKEIDYSAILTSSSPQVDARKIYRSLVDQVGEWFHVVTISNNSSVSYTGDNVLLDDMGLSATDANGIPPTGLKAMALHRERMFVTDGIYLYYAELGLPESFHFDSFIPVSSDDGYEINTMISFDQILLVLKENRVAFLSGTDEQSFELRDLHSKHGCRAEHSPAVAEGYCFWFGGDSFYLTDGNTVRPIGDPQVVDIINGIDPAYYHLIQGETYPTKKWYIATVPADGSSTPNKQVIYNYQTGAWHVHEFDGAVGTPKFVKNVPDSDGNSVLYCGTTGSLGHIWQFMSGDTDGGEAITWEVKTKAYGAEAEDRLKFASHFQVLFQTTLEAEDVTFTLYRDDETASEDTATINTFGRKLWKRTTLANNGDPGVFIQFQIQASSNSDIRILGIGFSLVTLGRQVPVV